MLIEYDPAKREATLAARGLDFEDAPLVFAGRHFTAPDPRDWGEQRLVTAGRLRGDMVVLVWTPRGAARRIISMRKASRDERAKFAHHFD